MVRSVNNTVVIDAAETYELKSTPLSGVADILDRIGLALSAVSRIPESLLHGRQQGGMNSTGASELEQWYARIGQEQETRLLPAIDRVVSLILKMQGQYTDDYLIKFLPLWVPSDKEQAEADKIKADTRATYNAMGSLDPSEVRAMLKDEGYNIDEIDLEYGEEETV
jgi:phage-related protein (TIGR01555 family)